MFLVSQMCELDACESVEGGNRCFLYHRCLDWILVRVEREAIDVCSVTDLWFG